MMNADLLISVPYTWVLALSGVLLAIGILGVLLRRNAITIFLSLEIMLNSGTLAFAAFAMHFAAIPGMEATALNGQMYIFFIIATPVRYIGLFRKFYREFFLNFT